MTLLEAISIDGVTFNLNERLRIDHEGDGPPQVYLRPGIYCITRIYVNQQRTPDVYLSGYRAERPGQVGAYWGMYLSQLREQGYVFRKLGSPRGRKDDGVSPGR